mmetsp:Transcript_29043/g.53373  ORF Transcript_29043/g.53373 Transcript_29043/m.53373 type:complete len:185 (-) Transcript_29043:765-1319(-)|eukprot:CAMPEP_0175074604 /NCGR_PEP_ID=MMETSP0052_2-20121109/21425_1 /TAXON_ID=51329 ORGANISM="Polytomella parva, Strain SAG 63-3" /NCGR_SAMPLE_ID=MMETSP0052_2 /ASSEMBLY_ACC=CAM_ASM_000194 /LENGTH=184 /DNA_ID=CAMNT_0016342973 /DNA_START=95 /DNA_END=649 /DNA_ORIENTATION=+
MSTEILVLKKELKSHPLAKKERERRRKSLRKASYFTGVVIGTITVRFLKNKLTQIPFLGGILKPVFGFFPTLLVGPVLGAAAVYGFENDGLYSVRKLVSYTTDNIIQDARNVASDVVAEVHDAVFLRRAVLYDELEKIAPAVEEAATEVARAAGKFKKSGGARESEFLSGGSDKGFFGWSTTTK